MRKSIGKNISKILGGKYSRKVLVHAKQPVTDALKTASKRVIKKTTDIYLYRSIYLHKDIHKDIYLQEKNSKLLMI